MDDEINEISRTMVTHDFLNNPGHLDWSRLISVTGNHDWWLLRMHSSHCLLGPAPDKSLKRSLNEPCGFASTWLLKRNCPYQRHVFFADAVPFSWWVGVIPSRLVVECRHVAMRLEEEASHWGHSSWSRTDNICPTGASSHVPKSWTSATDRQPGTPSWYMHDGRREYKLQINECKDTDFLHRRGSRCSFGISSTCNGFESNHSFEFWREVVVYLVQKPELSC